MILSSQRKILYSCCCSQFYQNKIIYNVCKFIIFQFDMERSRQCLTEKPLSCMTNFIQAHPYEYLRQLNATFDYYSKNNIKCYSNASRVKLPWKIFNQINIPKCFQQTFQKEKRDFVQMDSQDNFNQDETDKKIWKDHAQILKRYANVFRGVPRSSSTKIGKCNKIFAEKMIRKDRKNLFLKKIIEKGANVQYDQKSLQQQILHKLAIINEKKSLKRSQTAKTQASFQKNTTYMSQSNNLQSSYKKHRLSKKITSEQLEELKRNQYLMFDFKQDILQDYKKRIQAVDCSISTKKILETTDVIKEMQKILAADFSTKIQ